MPLNGTVKSAPSQLLGFDCNTVVSLERAKQFAKASFKFCIRYVARGDTLGSGDLTTLEATNILSAGLALMPVQHVSNPGWVPTQALGTEFGTNAAKHATAIGFPAGVNVWCDLEGVKNGTLAQSVIDFCNAWYVAVAAAGFVPGLYVGANAILSGHQLFTNLKFKNYWRALSSVPDVETRGYQMLQFGNFHSADPDLEGHLVNGIEVDLDLTQDDLKQGQVVWLAPN